MEGVRFDRWRMGTGVRMMVEDGDWDEDGDDNGDRNDNRDENGDLGWRGLKEFCGDTIR